MCTLAFAYKIHPEYPMIFIGNRDEFYERLTEEASVREGVLCGIDLEKGGTWTGISVSGRLAFLTNYRDFSLHVEHAMSRGFLVKDFLTGHETPEKYLLDLSKQKSRFNPFNLIVGDINQLYYYSNVNDTILSLDPGLYGLSNSLLNTEWPKVKSIKSALAKIISKPVIEPEALLEILEDQRQAKDEELPNTGIPHELERSLSSILIELEKYGTRHETLILIHHTGRVLFVEKSRAATGIWEKRQFTFDIIGG